MRAALMILPVLALSGCDKLKQIEGAIPKDLTPKVTFQQLKIKEVTFQGVDANFVFKVENPHPVSLNLASFTYDLDLEGTDFAKGTQDEGLTLKPKDSSKIRLPVSMAYKDVSNLIKAVKGKDNLDYTLKGDFDFNTPIGQITVPYNRAGDMPILRAPKFRVQGLRGDVNVIGGTASLLVDLVVNNEQSAAMDLNNFDYALQLGGREVATGLVPQLAQAGGSKETSVTLPIDISLVDLGASVVDSLVRKNPIDTRLTAGLEVGTPYGVLPFNIDKSESLRLR